MSPLPATLPMLAQSQSPPQSLVTSETTVTTNSSAEMRTSSGMTVQSEIRSSTSSSSSSATTTTTTTATSSSSNSLNCSVSNNENSSNNSSNENTNNNNMNSSSGSNPSNNLITTKSADSKNTLTSITSTATTNTTTTTITTTTISSTNTLNTTVVSSVTKNSTYNHDMVSNSPPENIKLEVKATPDSTKNNSESSNSVNVKSVNNNNNNTKKNNSDNNKSGSSNINCSSSSSSDSINNNSAHYSKNSGNTTSINGKSDDSFKLNKTEKNENVIKHEKDDMDSPSEIENNNNNNNNNNNSSEELLDKPRRILLKNVNPHIICNLCKGYLIDATTIVECLHSFCHSCIMKHLRTEQYCPRCEMMINTAKPNIKPDTTLQAIVYKLVPGLYEKELMRKRAFYRDRPEEAKIATPEQRGEDTEYLIFGPTENMSLSLEYADIAELPEGSDWSDLKRPKYLQCPAIFTVAHLKKFILLKFGINSNLFTVEIMYKVKTIVLSNHYTLMDVAYIYTWKRDAPMRFLFRIKEVCDFAEKLKACQRLMMKNKEINNGKRLYTKLSSSTSAQEENNRNSVISKNDSDEQSVNKNDNNSKKIIIKNEFEKNKRDDKRISPQRMNNNNNNVENSNNMNNVKKENELRKSMIKIEEIKIEITDIKQEPNEQVNKFIESNNQSNDIKSPVTKTSISNVSNTNRNSIGNQSTSSSLLKENSTDDSTTEANKVEKLKMTFSIKNKQSKIVTSSAEDSKVDFISKTGNKGNKTPKQQQHQQQQQQQQQQQSAINNTSDSLRKSPDQEERKVENIKLKIDLSKQSSVTIINMSGPENTRKEIVKPVKQEKEWKLKTRKEKETSPKSTSPKSTSPKSEDKYTIKPSNEDQQRHSPEENKKLVPPITIKAERASPKENSTVQLKIKQEESSKSSQDSVVTNVGTEKEDDEEKKSKFLNSFALTPIKSQTNSPDKNNDKKSLPSNIPTTSQATQWAISPNLNKNTNVSKRKSKEPVKTMTKKIKLEPSKLKLNDSKSTKSNEKSPNKETQTISFKLAPFPIDSSSSSSPPSIDLTKKQEDEKLMPAPPPLKMIDVLKKNGLKQPKQPRSPKWTTTNKAKPFQSNQMPTPPRSLAATHSITLPGIGNSKLPIIAAPPGNRTPIARRYPPILPKSPRPNPFANLPTEVNSLLQNNGTEIKQIPSGNNQDLKVYGPAIPIKTSNNPVSQSFTPMSLPHIPSRNPAKNPAANYLNYALLNASKTKVDVMPLGCRTPIYTPDSPIYSPSSPQYMPNYNIPTQPTYKYTKTQSSADNYLQNVLGQNKQLSGLFPAPPVKKPLESSIAVNSNKTPPPQLSVTAERTSDENVAKRSYPFSKSPPNLTDKSSEPPEKQAKVQSLLNSCNINIPSSLSITITNEDSESGAVSGSNIKRKSPVNNYIEIVKLPENQPVITNDQPSVSCNQKLKTNQSEIKSDISTASTFSSSLPAKTNSTKTITANNTPRSSPMQVTETNTVKSASSSPSIPLSSSTNSIDKKPDTVKTSPNSKEKKSTSEKKNSEKGQKKTQSPHDKKKSPENKSVKANEAAHNITPMKKFRHILPRVTSTSTIPNIPISTLSVSTPKTSPSTQRNNLKQSPQQKSPTDTCNKKFRAMDTLDDKKLEILDLTESSSKTPSPTLPSLPSPATTVAAPPSNLPPQIPPGASDIAAFLNETILRAQQHTAASANGVFLPHLAAAASFNPSFASINFGYNIQQAYLIEQFSRMQKAGHEALEKYMQKLKGNNSNNGSNKSRSNSPNETSSNNTNNTSICVANGTVNNCDDAHANTTIASITNSPTKTSENK